MAMLLRDEMQQRFSAGNAAEEYRRFEECLTVYDLADAKESVGKLTTLLGFDVAKTVCSTFK